MTIFALSSGSGASGIAVIRISGSETSKIIKKITGQELPSPRMASLRKINNINTSELIDEGLILWFPGPASYTGEDLAEIHVHGSRAVINQIYSTLSEFENCRVAEPGEFTKLALQNEKINLLKAESIGDLISSETEIQRQQAIEIMKGSSQQKFSDLRNQLIKILSNVEAKIDFPEEDLPKEISKEIKITAEKIILTIENILDDQKVGERIRAGFKIAIVGPPNVGKSSLINLLASREVAIVSEIAGTTRDVIETHLNIDGYPVIISDTAGIRDSKNEIEQKGIKLALKRAEEANLRVVMIEPKNLNFTGFLKDLFDENSILVINKIDKEKININEQIKKLDPILISISKNSNIDKLIQKIRSHLKNKFNKTEDVFITRERHRLLLQECLEHLRQFYKKNDVEDFDKAAEDLRLATRSLGKIIGKVDVEEILGSIFNDFCIGK